MNQLLERNSLVLPALIIAAAIVVAGWISAPSGRYQPLLQEGRGVIVIDTKSGDVYTPTSRVRDGKLVWTRRGPRRGVIDGD